MTTFAHCAGHGCPIRDTCAKYRNRWNAPLGTLHWWGIADSLNRSERIATTAENIAELPLRGVR